MLAKADVLIENFLRIFGHAGVSVAFLVPTETGYYKSIMDATAPVREFLLEMNLHDYEKQKQGPENKVLIPANFVNENSLTRTVASLYRPKTKKGDPRVWFHNLKSYCVPYNLLALISFNKEIFVFNLSKPEIAQSLSQKGFALEILLEARRQDTLVAEELLKKIKAIHDMGFIPSITEGDPGVGDTLEHALGIQRNNLREPDYRGIELKASRLTRNGERRAITRSTLFTKVPDEGMTYREIVENYGKWQIPRGETVARLQLYETFRVSRPNAYDLVLAVENDGERLSILHEKDAARSFVSAWQMKTLKEALQTKHKETFWVKAVSETRNGREFFRYDRILHTKKPNVSLLPPLFEADKITVDLAAHFKEDGKWRDHGVLFKMMPADIPLLLGSPIEYVL